MHVLHEMQMTKKAYYRFWFLFGGTTVFWLSKKHNCVTKFTMEANYISCNKTISNAVWIKCFVDSLNLDIPSKPINVFCDYKSTILLIKSGAHRSNDKYINLKYHYIYLSKKKEEKISLYSINCEEGCN
jgi:hypothetical protein